MNEKGIRLTLGEILTIISILGSIGLSVYHYGQLSQKVDSLGGWVQNIENRMDANSKR